MWGHFSSWSSNVLLRVKMNLEKAATILTDLHVMMFVYKMRLFMNDVLFIMLIQFIDNDWFNRCNANEYCIQGYFCPMSFSPCYNCKRFYLVLNSPLAVMLTKIFVCNIEFDHAVLNSSSDNEDERGENNTGANISLYTVYHL